MTPQAPGISQPPAQRVVDRPRSRPDLTDQVDVEHELPQSGLDGRGEAPQLLDEQPASITPEDVGIGHPVAHIALVADRVEEGMGAVASGSRVGQALLPLDGVAARLPRSHPSLPLEQIREDLAGLLGVDEPDVRPGWRHQHGGVATVDPHLGRAGGLAESEAAVDARLGRDQPGQGVASRPGVLEHARHQPAQEAPPAMGGVDTNGGHAGERDQRGDGGGRGGERQVQAGDGGVGHEAAPVFCHPGPIDLHLADVPLVPEPVLGIVGPRVEERHPHRGHEPRLLTWLQPAYLHIHDPSVTSPRPRGTRISQS